MKKELIFLIFALFLFFLSLYLLYQILSPFFTSILWAIFLAMIFYPLFKRLRSLLKKPLLSSLSMTLLVLFIIVLPFGLLMVSLAMEVVEVYHQVDEMIKTGQLQTYFERIQQLPFFSWVWEKLDQYLDLSKIEPASLLLKNLKQISTFLFNQTSAILKGVSTFILSFFFMLLSLYYLFKDGGSLFEKVKEMIPLPMEEKDLLLNRFKEMILATMYGGILMAIIQGALGSLSLWALGFSSPIFWGTAMALLSFIPIGGTALIWVPLAITLLIQGMFLKAVVLLALGVFVISMADNLLRPLFISSRTNIHPLLLFFAVLGGIQAFGLIGLVAGPLVMTLFLTVVEIYIRGIKESKRSERQIEG